MPNNEPMSYGSVAYLKKEVETKKEALEDYRQESRAKLTNLIQDLEMSEALYRMAHKVNLDIPKFMQALHYIEVRNPAEFNPKHPEDLKLLDDAMDWFAGTEKQYATNLVKEFMGVKNYDGFYHQRTDCQYGYGPRHGSIVFSIGLSRNVRESMQQHASIVSLPNSHPATHLPEQIRDNCIYFLQAFKEGKIEPNAITLWPRNRYSAEMQNASPTGEEESEQAEAATHSNPN